MIPGEKCCVYSTGPMFCNECGGDASPFVKDAIYRGISEHGGKMIALCDLVTPMECPVCGTTITAVGINLAPGTGLNLDLTIAVKTIADAVSTIPIVREFAE